jgi:cytoskeletal protein RodZ
MEKSSLSQILKARRTALKKTLEQVEVATKIRGKYLTKLESGDYEGLPNDIYTKGFVAKYAEFLGLDKREIVAKYIEERGGFIEEARLDTVKPIKSQKFIFTPKLLAAGLVLLAGAIVVGYLSWQFSALSAPPELEVESPQADQVIVGSLIDVTGRVSAGADVTVNDSPVLTDASGKFSEKLALVEGLNTIKITARNRTGKETTVNRSILAKVPVLDGGQAGVPGEVFDGVAVGISIRKGATWLIVEVDGREAFRGTMLDGTSQSFRGKDKIKVTTGNAGNTHIAVTNSQEANHQFSPVGADGEIKRDLEFAKDTQFQ